MKKILAIGLAAALSLTMLAGCGETGNTDDNGGNGGNGGNGNNNETTNTAPVIAGVKEEVTIMAGTEFNALEGVTATDAEDGDLTSKIEVTSDELTFTNGKVTPTVPNELMGYFVEYSVKDSGGKEATASTTLFVTEKVAELENVYTADFSAAPAAKYSFGENKVEGANDNHWWEPTFNGEGAGSAVIEDGELVFDVTNRGESDDHAMISRWFGDVEPGEYRFIAWGYADKEIDVHMNAILEDACVPDGTPEDQKWDKKNLGGGRYDGKFGTTPKAVELDFNLTADMFKPAANGKAEVRFRICVGGAKGEAVKVNFNKIAIYKTTGVETKTPIVERAFKGDIDGLYDTNEAKAAAGADGAEIAITYGEQNQDWEAKATIGLNGENLNKGEMYYYSFKLKAEQALTVNICVEQNDVNDAYLNRASFHGFNLAAGEEKVISVTFKAGEGQSMNDVLKDAVCRLYLGIRGEEGQTANKATVSEFVFGTVTGDKKTEKNVDKFVLFGKGSTNETDSKLPFDVFNGSDDDPANKGIGTAYIKDGKLVYEIEEGSASGGQNKLVIGYWENPINLPKDAYYVVSFKVKASASIGMDVCLHDMDCGDNWDNGLLYRRASWMEEGNYAIGTTETTVEFTTEVVYKESKCELILEFGSEALSKLSGVTIEISEIKIGVKKLAD